MHVLNGNLVYAATDLSDFHACEHLTQLSHAAVLGGPKPPKYDDPGVEVLKRRGEEHERTLLAEMGAAGLSVASIARGEDEWPPRWDVRAHATLEAMRAGAHVIYQGVLFDGIWVGLPDFLTRVDTPSGLGEWSYEVVDAKLAREAKGRAVLQIVLYSDLLGAVQGTEPAMMHLALGGPEPNRESFRVADYAAYYRLVRGRFESAVAADPPPTTYPEPVNHCTVCDWNAVCTTKRRQDDHLSLVANIRRSHRARLAELGVTTMTALGALDLPVRPRLRGVSDAALARVREQARIQVEGRAANAPRYEFLTPVTAEQGFASLPEPSDGDLFFDLEGDPHALDDGLEYLFGWVDRSGKYTGHWALDRAAEKRGFEQFIDTVVDRLERNPDLHIFHYGGYETGTVKRLMGRHGTREDDVDGLLRGEVFVDLLRVVRQGIRASVESYSIKKMEPFYGFERKIDLRDASAALGHFEAYLALGTLEGRGDRLLREIEGYNRDDCVSTLRLQEWLEGLRAELVHSGEDVPRPAPPEAEASKEVTEQRQRVEDLVTRLTADLPDEESAPSAAQRARWLLAQLLGWHRREKKSMWWDYFRCLALNDEELIEDRGTLGGLAYEGEVGTVKRSLVHRYRFPPQEHAVRDGSTVRDASTGKSPGTVVAFDPQNRTVDLKRAKTSQVPHPTALVAFDDIADGELRESLLRIAEWVAENGIDGEGPFQAARDLLVGKPPSVPGWTGGPLVGEEEDIVSAAKRLVVGLHMSTLPVQGPPGAGKTYTGARMIVALLRAGNKVGITANSHKVITNLLDEVCRVAEEGGFAFNGVQRASEDQQCVFECVKRVATNEAAAVALANGTAALAAGTAWLWAREEMTGLVDVLFVDEAGQMSLANVLAVSPAAGSLVLLGDPQQLEQPQQGVHPPGSDISALQHVLGDDTTMPPDRGLFLSQTWRLHPAICAFTSEMFYANRLTARPDLDRQRLAGAGFDDPGLVFIPVPHTGNRNESPEEVERVAQLVERLCAPETAWTDMHRVARSVDLDDVLVVSPYNVQVEALTAALPDGARVGTVDKFQGQEAPVVIYSMASSSAEDAPRGMEFLFNPNRLNVATSRARCVAIVVASPDLFSPACETPRQMRLANAFCRLQELAS